LKAADTSRVENTWFARDTYITMGIDALFAVASATLGETA